MRGEYVGNLRPDVSAPRLEQQLALAKEDLAELVGKKQQFSPEHQSIYDRYRRDIEKFLGQLGGKPHTDSAGHTWIEVPLPAKRGPTQMYGRADPDLVRALAAASAGAAAGLYVTNGDTAGGIVGGLAGLGLRAHGGKLLTSADYGLGASSTRVRNISPVLLKRLRDFERHNLTDSWERIKASEPFLIALDKLPKKVKGDFDLALTANDPAGIKKVLDSHPEVRKAWTQVRKVLDEVEGKLLEHRLLKEEDLIIDYFPRIVVDRDGLAKALGGKAKEGLGKRIADAEARAAKVGKDLTPVELSLAINQFLRGLGSGDFAPGFLKDRQIKDVSHALREFYASPAEALHTYLASATKAIEKAKLFGRDLVRHPETGQIQIDLSIGNLVREEMGRGKITEAGARELESLLQSRFGPGEQTTNPILQAAKNYTNAGLLGNIVSAATQLTDAFGAIYAHDTLPALEGLVRTLANKRRVRARDFGLMNHISEEFANTATSAKFLNAMFKWNGFTTVDMFGKAVNLEASLTKAQRWVKSARGQRELARKYAEAYGDEFPQFVEDLKAKKMTDNVASYLFSELSDLQPITKMEMPQMYNDLPNGRTLYMLRTFMLKQFDIVRRDGIQEIRQGNVARGIYNLTRYGLLMGIAGATTEMIRDWMMGRIVDFSKGDIAMNLLKTFGWSEWVRDSIRKGNPAQAIGTIIAPPYRMFEDLWKAAGAPGSDLSQAKIDAAKVKLISYLGTPGKLIYAHLLGGADRANAAEERAKRREERRKESK
jgi:hypothetical protein